MPKEQRNARSRWVSGIKADYAEVALAGVDCAARLPGAVDAARPPRPVRRRIGTPLPDPGRHARRRRRGRGAPIALAPGVVADVRRGFPGDRNDLPGRRRRDPAGDARRLDGPDGRHAGAVRADRARQPAHGVVPRHRVEPRGRVPSTVACQHDHVRRGGGGRAVRENGLRLFRLPRGRVAGAVRGGPALAGGDAAVLPELPLVGLSPWSFSVPARPPRRSWPTCCATPSTACGPSWSWTRPAHSSSCRACPSSARPGWRRRRRSGFASNTRSSRCRT